MASAGHSNTINTLKPKPTCGGSDRFERQVDMVLLSIISYFIYLHIGIH